MQTTKIEKDIGNGSRHVVSTTTGYRVRISPTASAVEIRDARKLVIEQDRAQQRKEAAK